MSFYINQYGERIEVPGHRGIKYWKLRSQEAVKRRQDYKKSKEKKTRLHCEQCIKRFIPKRTTKRFCSNRCSTTHHRMEWKRFKGLGFIAVWDSLPAESRNQYHKLAWMRARYRDWIYSASNRNSF